MGGGIVCGIAAKFPFAEMTCCDNPQTCGAEMTTEKECAGNYELITVKAGDGKSYPVKGEGVVSQSVLGIPLLSLCLAGQTARHIFTRSRGAFPNPGFEHATA